MQEGYIQYMMTRKILSQEDEFHLAKEWIMNNNEEALYDLIESHVKLVVKIAYRYNHYGLNIQDVIQEGVIGLIKAAKKFNPEHNVRFSGYAKWWIRASIQDYILKNWSIVRMGSTKAHKTLFFNLNRIKKQIYKIEEGGLPENCVKSISESLKISAKDIVNMDDRLNWSDLSLNTCLYNSEQNYQDQLVDLEPTQDEIVQKQNMIKKQLSHIQNALDILTDQEKHVITNRYLVEEKTFSLLGKHLGLTKESIRQIEQKAFRKMRRHLIYNSGIRKDDLYIS